jgi:transposase
MTSSQLACVGVDVGKSCFDVVRLNQHGAVALRGKHTRDGILAALVQCDAQRFAFETSGGAHRPARRLSAEAREVRLLVPADVRAFVRTQKNDHTGAQALAEAALRSAPQAYSKPSLNSGRSNAGPPWNRMRPLS